MRWAIPLLGALLVAGCTLGPPAPGTPTAPPTPTAVTVEVPADGGGPATCPPRSSVPEAVPFLAEAVRDAGGHGPGIHKINDTTLLFVWASYNGTLRQDRISRANEVHVARDANGTAHVCTRADIIAPTEVDGTRRTYDVALRMTASPKLPRGPLHVVVNWVVGCPCDRNPSGNATADFS